MLFYDSFCIVKKTEKVPKLPLIKMNITYGKVKDNCLLSNWDKTKY